SSALWALHLALHDALPIWNRDHAASADRDRPLRWARGPGWGPSTAARRRDAAIGPLGARNQGRPLASLPDSCGLLPGIRSRRFQDRKSTRLNASHVSISYA